MMQKIKRPVSILLALMLVAGIFAVVPFTAGATSYGEESKVYASQLKAGDTIGTGVSMFYHENYTFTLKGGRYGTGYYDEEENDGRIFDLCNDDLQVEYDRTWEWLDYYGDSGIYDENTGDTYYPATANGGCVGKWYVIAVNGKNIVLGGFTKSDDPSSGGISMSVGKYFRMGYYKGVDVDWYCVKINDTGYFMYCKYALKAGKFGANATYKTSDIHTWLDINSGGTFADDLGFTDAEMSVVRTVDLSSTGGDGTDSFIIAAYENNEMNKGTKVQAPYRIDTDALVSIYWLRTARDTTNARVVNHSKDGSPIATVAARYSGVGNSQWIRPMFYLDNAAFKKLNIRGDGTENDPYVIKSTVYNDPYQDPELEECKAGDYFAKGVRSANLGFSDEEGYTLTLQGGTYGKYVESEFTVCNEDLTTELAFMETNEDGDFYMYDYNTAEKYYPVVNGVKSDIFVLRSINHTTKKIIVAGRPVPADPAYTVTCKNWDGSVLETDKKVTVGTIPTYDGATPVRAEDDIFTYVFGGWTPTVTEVTNNVVYTAIYDSTIKVEEKMTVLDLTKHHTTSWPERALPFSTTRFSVDPYFIENEEWINAGNDGWLIDGDYPDVSYFTINALNGEKITKLVIHRNYYDNVPVVTVDGNEIYRRQGDDEDEFIFDSMQASSAKVFASSGDDYITIDRIEVYYAGGPAGYTVTWKDDDGTTLETDEDVIVNKTPTFDGKTPTKESTAEYNYTFAGWAPEVTAVEGDTEYTATYTSTKRPYNITWKNEDGSVIGTTSVPYGEMPTYADQEKPATAQYSYPFLGWAPEITSVTGDAEYTAQFGEKVNKYTITWKNEDGSVIDTTTVAYGETPAYTGETPVKDSDAQFTYTFLGWSPAVTAVNGDAEYTATYSADVNKYTVKWMNNGELLKTDTVSYGETPVYTGETPVKDSDAEYNYTFAGWTPAVDAVSGDVTYNATFNNVKRSYNITWKNDDGSVIDITSVAYGETPTHTVPEKPEDALYTYSFAGWTPEITAVNGDAEYTAQFNAEEKEVVLNGIIDGMYYVNGEIVKGAGIVKVGDDIYFIKQNGAVYTGSLSVGEDKTNGIIPAGNYSFGSDGKMILKNGIINGKYYENSILIKGRGLVEWNGSIYFIKESGNIAVNTGLFVADAKTNGVMPAGKYSFDADGKLIVNDGVVDGMYYNNGVLVKGVGLVEWNGSIYFVKENSSIFANDSLYVVDAKTNNLAPAGKYFFDADGKLVPNNGIVDGYYYENNVLVKGKGIIEFEENLYFVKQNGSILKDSTLFVAASKANGLVEAGSYRFDADGKLVG